MILAAEWIVPISSQPLRHHAIEIQKGVIRAIRPVRKSDRMMNGVCLMPGLVNAHTHLAYTVLRNQLDALPFFAWIRKLTEIKYQKWTDDDVIASTQAGIDECLRAGITTVADMCDFESGLKTLSRSPLRGIFYWEIFGIEKEQAAVALEFVQHKFPKMVTRYSSDRLKIGLSPHACFTVRPELYRKVAKWATARKIPISFHLSESEAEEEFIANRSGPISDFMKTRAADWKINARSAVAHLEKTGIFRAKPLLAHLVQVSDSDLDILSKHDVSVVHCAKSNAKFGHGIAPVAKMLDRNFQVGIGTDSIASNNRFDLFEEMRFALLQQRAGVRKPVLNEAKILELATLGGATAMRMQNQIGSLEPGKLGDIIAVRIPAYGDPDHVVNHLVHSSSADDVAAVWINGQSVSNLNYD